MPTIGKLPIQPADMSLQRLVEELRFLARSAGLSEGESLCKMEDALDAWVQARDARKEAGYATSRG